MEASPRLVLRVVLSMCKVEDMAKNTDTQTNDYIVTLNSGVPILLRNAFIAGNGIAGDLADGTTYRIADTEYIEAVRAAD